MSGESFLWVQGLWSYEENIKMAAFSFFLIFHVLPSATNENHEAFKWYQACMNANEEKLGMWYSIKVV